MDIRTCKCVIAIEACGNMPRRPTARRHRNRITSSATASSPRDCAGSGSPTPSDATSNLLLAANGARPTATAHVRALLLGRARTSSPARHATAATSMVSSWWRRPAYTERGGVSDCRVVVSCGVPVRLASGLRPQRFGHFCSGFYVCGTPIAGCLSGCVVLVTAAVLAGALPAAACPPAPGLAHHGPRAREFRVVPVCSRRSLRLTTKFIRSAILSRKSVFSIFLFF